VGVSLGVSEKCAVQTPNKSEDLSSQCDSTRAYHPPFKTRRLVGYNVPAVLLMTQASIEIGKPALGADVSPLRKPVNVDELNP